MILLVLFMGAVLVYLLMFMAFIAAMVGLILAFGVYALSYLVLLGWTSFRNRASPEWKFEGTLWKPNLEDVQEYSLMAGLISIMWMVVGFFAYVFTQDWGSTIGWVVGCTVLAGLIANYDHHKVNS